MDSWSKAYGIYGGAGIQLAVAVTLGVWGGWKLDSLFHTKPLFLVVGTLLGCAAGFINLYRLFKSHDEKKP